MRIDRVHIDDFACLKDFDLDLRVLDERVLNSLPPRPDPAGERCHDRFSIRVEETGEMRFETAGRPADCPYLRPRA